MCVVRSVRWKNFLVSQCLKSSWYHKLCGSGRFSTACFIKSKSSCKKETYNIYNKLYCVWCRKEQKQKGDHQKFLVVKVETCYVKPKRWRSGSSARFAFGVPGVYSFCRVIPKDFKKWYPQLPCWALGI